MFGDTGVLSFQLDNYRWEDHMRRMRDIRERDVEQDTVAVVVSQYNDLVRRYNALAEAALEAGQDADASQARAGEAERQTGLLHRELADLKQRQASEVYELEKSVRFWTKETEYYKDRALAAEAESKELRSQKD